MRKTISLPVLPAKAAPVLLACWLGAAALAQDAGSEPQATAPTRGEVKAMRDFKLLDFDGDGKLSRAEVRLFPRLAAAFDEADTDHDGFVSFEEIRAFAARYRAQREREREQGAAAALPAPPQP